MWLRGENERWSRELLTSIRDFATSISGVDTMKNAALEIAKFANEKVCVADHDSQTCAF